MSAVPDNEFDLEKLFLPAWAQQPSSANQYAKFEGEDDRADRRLERRGPRGRRDLPSGSGGARRADKRRRDDRRGPARSEEGRPRPARDERPGSRRGEPRERRPPPAPLPELEVALIPEPKGVESLARQIKMTGRAYPLFDIAQMILQKPERHNVEVSVKKDSAGAPVQALYVCALDETLWLSEDDAIAHVLKNHFTTFYQAERTPTEPPKGRYTFVAQCGLSGIVLGPPNYHDYQNQLRKLHAERFSRMSFDDYKARVKIVRDEEVIKKWIDDQSFKTEYVCLNVPEPLKLARREDVEKHFREIHKVNIIKQVETHMLAGAASRAVRSADLARLIRSVWEDQRRFPLQIATVLSQQFAALGLQFFKVNRTVTHVCVARPHYLDLEETPVSPGVKRIVEYINAHPKCTRRQLMDALAPSPAPESPPLEAAAAGANKPEATAEQTEVGADLHWLIHQGHVIEFANSTLETAKKPLPKPPKPPAKPTEAVPNAASDASSATAASEAKVEGATTAPVVAVEQENAAPGIEGAAAEPEKAAEERTASEASRATPASDPVEAPAAPVESPS